MVCWVGPVRSHSAAIEVDAMRKYGGQTPKPSGTYHFVGIWMGARCYCYCSQSTSLLSTSSPRCALFLCVFLLLLLLMLLLLLLRSFFPSADWAHSEMRNTKPYLYGSQVTVRLPISCAYVGSFVFKEQLIHVAGYTIYFITIETTSLFFMTCRLLWMDLFSISKWTKRSKKKIMIGLLISITANSN